MKLRIYEYAGCSTCKKALAWLKAHDLAYESVPIVEAPPSARELASLWKLSGLPLAAFFNTSGESYRAGNFKVRRDAMSDAEQLDALASDGKLLKRPILVVTTGAKPSRVIVGFKEDEYASLAR